MEYKPHNLHLRDTNCGGMMCHHPRCLSCFPKDKPEEGNDPVGHPSHYCEHASGIECIKITEHMGFTLGNAIKYIWRADLKDDKIQDLEKAIWYINREIAKEKLHEDIPF